MRLLLIRHGESQGNAEGRMQGRADFPLTALGSRQARALADRLVSLGIDALYSSPLLRARMTADAVAGAAGLDVVEDDRLQEYDVGDISGMTWRDVKERYPEIARQYREESGFPSFPGSESRDDFMARVRDSIGEIVGRHEGSGTVAVVTHGWPILVYVMDSLGTEYSRPPRFRVDNTSVHTIEYGERTGFPARTVVGLNDTSHLLSLEQVAADSWSEEAER
jgi:probable phosphoglycerate mutase